MSEKNQEKDIDPITGVETTGHEWDGIKELNNPLPRWWLWTFYACIVWAVGYMILYPAIPLINSATPGLLGVTERGNFAIAVAKAEKAQKKFVDQIAAKSLEEIRKDQNLFRFAQAGGKAAFAVNCIQCHGSGAQGSPGYPNLNDDDWIWGGSLEAIYTSIRHGIRFAGDDDTRVSEMPAFGRDEILEKEQVAQVAAFVVSLTGQQADADKIQKGAAIYEENCASCHGDKGQGSQEFGAPNLSDAITFYGDKEKDIIRQVNSPRHGAMPAWVQRLDDVTIKNLAVYVHALGGGE